MRHAGLLHVYVYIHQRYDHGESDRTNPTMSCFNAKGEKDN